MMKIRFPFRVSPSTAASIQLRYSARWLKTSLALIAVLLAACAPAATSTTPPPAVTQPPAVLVPTVTVAAPTLELPTQPAPTEELAPTALPVATSRGPDLHGTDPTTVSLASGGLQFVEFFRFT